MKLQEFRELVERYEFRGMLKDARMKLMFKDPLLPSQWDHGTLMCSFLATDRDEAESKDRQRIFNTRMISDHTLLILEDERAARLYIEAFVRETVLHEMNESLWFDGSIIRDPHD